MSKPRNPTSADTASLDRRPLLILELGALRAHGLSLKFGTLTGMWSAVTGIRPHIDEAATAKELRSKIGARRQLARMHPDVFVVAHSSPRGVDVGAKDTIPWPEFAALLARVRPRRIVFLACDAGKTDSVKALFKGIRDLEEVVAPPVEASGLFGVHLVTMLPVLLRSTFMSTHALVTAFSGAMMLVDGGHLRYRTRDDAEAEDDMSRMLDLVSEQLDPLRRSFAEWYGHQMNRWFPRAWRPVPHRRDRSGPTAVDDDILENGETPRTSSQEVDEAVRH